MPMGKKCLLKKNAYKDKMPEEKYLLPKMAAKKA